MGCNLYAPFFRVIFIDGVGASGLFPSWVSGVGFRGGGLLYPPLFRVIWRKAPPKGRESSGLQIL